MFFQGFRGNFSHSAQICAVSDDGTICPLHCLPMLFVLWMLNHHPKMYLLDSIRNVWSVRYYRHCVPRQARMPVGWQAAPAPQWVWHARAEPHYRYWNEDTGTIHSFNSFISDNYAILSIHSYLIIMEKFKVSRVLLDDRFLLLALSDGCLQFHSLHSPHVLIHSYQHADACFFSFLPSCFDV